MQGAAKGLLNHLLPLSLIENRLRCVVLLFYFQRKPSSLSVRVLNHILMTVSSLQSLKILLKLGSGGAEVQAFTTVQSSVTLVHVTSSIDISCAGQYQLIHRLIPVHGPGVA